MSRPRPQSSAPQVSGLQPHASGLRTPTSALARMAANHEHHFCGRVRDRFGLKVSASRYRRWCRLVLDVAPGVFPAGRQGPDRSIWMVTLGGKAMRVVLDHRTEGLVTCLPLHEHDAHARRQARQDIHHRNRRLRQRKGPPAPPWKS